MISLSLEWHQNSAIGDNSNLTKVLTNQDHKINTVKVDGCQKLITTATNQFFSCINVRWLVGWWVNNDLKQ